MSLQPLDEKNGGRPFVTTRVGMQFVQAKENGEYRFERVPAGG